MWFIFDELSLCFDECSSDVFVAAQLNLFLLDIYGSIDLYPNIFHHLDNLGASDLLEHAKYAILVSAFLLRSIRTLNWPKKKIRILFYLFPILLLICNLFVLLFLHLLQISMNSLGLMI